MRCHEQTVLRSWLKRYMAEGIAGLADAPRPDATPKVKPEYRELLLQVVGPRPRSLNRPYSLWTLQRLADCMAEQTGIHSSWLPTLRAMWSPQGQQVMIPTPGQPNRHYRIGAVNYRTGEMFVIVRRHKRRREIAELLQLLVDKHPQEIVYVAWDIRLGP